MPQDSVFSLKPRPRLEAAHQAVHRQIQTTNHAASRLPYISDLATPDEVNGRDNCRAMGFSNLAPIIWHKIANAAYEAEGNGGAFLGKPYEPNAVIKNDIEFILMLRKPGGYRRPRA
jgi:hypothetical protein